MLFHDIETVKEIHSSYSEEEVARLREKYGNDFDFMPEFNRILTITVGMKHAEGAKVENLPGTEKEQIEKFFEISRGRVLCGWNCKGFDLPFIVRRAMFHGIRIPNNLKMNGKKPWEITNILDLRDVYKHTGYRAASLGEACVFVGIPTPKDAMDGSEVQSYHDAGKDAEILLYCRKDVEATIAMHDRLSELNMI